MARPEDAEKLLYQTLQAVLKGANVHVNLLTPKQRKALYKKFQELDHKIRITYQVAISPRTAGPFMEGFQAEEPDAPQFSVEYLRGYRNWYFDFNELRLRSTGWDYFWENIEEKSVHIQSAGNDQLLLDERCEYPTRKCGRCGFYAYFAEENILSPANITPMRIPVCGTIAGYGRVVVGPLGFRAQYATILGLCATPRVPESLFNPSHLSYLQMRNTLAEMNIHNEHDLQNQLREYFHAFYPGVPVYDTVGELIEARPPLRPEN